MSTYCFDFFPYFNVAGPQDQITTLERHVNIIRQKRDRHDQWLCDRRSKLRGRMRETVIHRTLKQRTEECASKRSNDPILSTEGRLAAKVRSDARKYNLPSCHKESHLPEKCRTKREAPVFVPPPTVTPTLFVTPEYNFTFSYQPMVIECPPAKVTKRSDPAKHYFEGKWLSVEEITEVLERKNSIALAYKEALQRRKSYEQFRRQKRDRLLKFQHCLWSMRELELLPLDDFHIPRQPIWTGLRRHKRTVYPWNPIHRIALLCAEKDRAKLNLPSSSSSSVSSSSTSSGSRTPSSGFTSHSSNTFAMSIDGDDDDDTDKMDIDSYAYRNSFPSGGSERLPRLDEVYSMTPSCLQAWKIKGEQMNQSGKMNSYARKFYAEVAKKLADPNYTSNFNNNNNRNNNGNANGKRNGGGFKGKGKQNGKNNNNNNRNQNQNQRQNQNNNNNNNNNRNGNQNRNFNQNNRGNNGGNKGGNNIRNNNNNNNNNNRVNKNNNRNNNRNQNQKGRRN